MSCRFFLSFFLVVSPEFIAHGSTSERQISLPYELRQLRRLWRKSYHNLAKILIAMERTTHTVNIDVRRTLRTTWHSMMMSIDAPWYEQFQLFFCVVQIFRFDESTFFSLLLALHTIHREPYPNSPTIDSDVDRGWLLRSSMSALILCKVSIMDWVADETDGGGQRGQLEYTRAQYIFRWFDKCLIRFLMTCQKLR